VTAIAEAVVEAAAAEALATVVAVAVTVAAAVATAATVVTVLRAANERHTHMCVSSSAQQSGRPAASHTLT